MELTESMIKKTALIISVLGIAVLLLILEMSPPEQVLISNLDGVVDQTVYVSGQVVGLNEGEGVTFLMLQKDEIVTVTLFGPTPMLEEGDYVQVRGVVEKDEGDGLGLVGEEVRVI